MDPFPQSNHLFDDIRRRTHNTIMMYDGLPVLVFYISGVNVQMYDLKNASSATGGRTVPYTDTKLVDRVPTLGYANVVGSRAMYVARNTARSQRAGLPVECLIAHDGRYVGPEALYTQQFTNMLLGKYPSMQEAYQALKDKMALTVAFSKTYAMDSTLNIFHRGRLLGKLVRHVSMPGYDIQYHSSVVRPSFYQKNFRDRYDTELREFKP